MVDSKQEKGSKFFSPKVPQKSIKKVANRNKKNLFRKKKLPAPLCYLTEEMIAVIMDYHTLRYLAYLNMGLKLNCTSNYKVFRVDTNYYYGAEQENDLEIFTRRWKGLMAYGVLHWPEAICYMNSLSLAYVDSEYDSSFRQLTKVGPAFLNKLIKYFLKIFKQF